MWPVFFFFQAEDGIRDYKVTGVQTCALPIWGQPRQRMVDGVELTLDLGHVVGARCALQALLQQGQDFTVGAAALAGILVEDDVVEGLAQDLGLLGDVLVAAVARDRKSTRLNSSHLVISYAVFCLEK